MKPSSSKIHISGPMLVIHQASSTTVFMVPEGSFQTDVVPIPNAAGARGYEVRLHRAQPSPKDGATGLALAFDNASDAHDMQKLLGQAVRKVMTRRYRKRPRATWLLLMTSALCTLSIFGAYRVNHNLARPAQPLQLTQTMASTQSAQKGASPSQAHLQGFPPSPSLPPSQVAPLLRKGVASGKYSLQLGKLPGGKSPLYVFEDPQCIHCQAFAPELQKLEQTHQVFVFPVSVIGGQSSAKLSGLVLCAKPADRERSWLLAQSGALLISPSKSSDKKPSEDCLKSVNANDAMFSALKLPGTPTLFDGSGNMMPLTIEHTAEAVDRWLMEASK